MISGKRVRLRAIEREDIPTFVRWFNDPDVRQYIQIYAPMSRAAEERWFEDRLSHKDDHIFCIQVPEGDAWVTVGNCGLHQIDRLNSSATLGVVIGEQAYWGRGYGTDAVVTMTRFAMRTMNLHRVELEVYAFNPRAIRCYEKAGFRLEGTRRQAHYHDGAYHDVHLMSILRHELGDT